MNPPAQHQQNDEVVSIPAILIPIPEFSDIWNHNKHFIIASSGIVKLWGNVVLREIDEKGIPTNREILCAVSYIEEHSEGLTNGCVVVALEMLHTTSEYANRYGNCSVVLKPPTARPIPPSQASTNETFKSAESYAKGLIEHDADIRKDEREKVLDDICNNCGGLADGGCACKTCYVRSLRSERAP